MIYVTHDQTEALTFADRVVVMSEGEVVQVGTPEALFDRPAHTLRRLFHRLAGHELPGLRGVEGARRCCRAASASPCRAPMRRCRGQRRARHPARIRQPGAGEGAAGRAEARRGSRPPPHRARRAGRPARRRDPAGGCAVPAEACLALDAARHAGLCRWPAGREGRPEHGQADNNAPGSWCCRWWRWWPSPPSSR